MARAPAAEHWPAIKRLFWETAALPAVEREPHLARSTVDPAVLREVRRLLAVEAAAGERFDDRPTFHRTRQAARHDSEPHGPGTPPNAAPPGVPFEGRQLGPYQVLRRVGEGGMGTVYEAVRTDGAYTHRVAIKTVWRGADSALLTRRLRSERQILASLAHPNIAQLLDGGATPEGLPYLVMEFVEGHPIDAWCDAQTLGIPARLDLFRQVCAAVAHAHRHLVVHRDIKPSNVFVTADGTVKLLDFGVAKLLADGPDGVGRPGTLTGAGVSPFTAAFAAPEQLRAGGVTTAADVYALGALLHLLITGHTPLGIDTMAPAEAILAVLDRPVPPLADHVDDAAAHARRLPSAARLARALRGDLDAIVRTALRKEPARRYGTVDALADDVKRYLRGDRVLARADTVGYRVRTVVRRHPGSVLASALLLCTLLGGATATAVQARRARAAQVRAERVSAFLRDLLSSVRPDASGRDARVSAVLDTASHRVARELDAAPASRAEVESIIGQSYEALGRYGEAEPHLAFALASSTQHEGPASPAALGALVDLAELQLATRNLPRADSLLARALVLAQTRGIPPDTLVATVLATRASVAHERGDNAAAERLHRDALALRRRLLPANDDLIATSLVDVAVTLGEQNRWAEAEPLHREALRILRANHPGPHSSVAGALNALATALDLQGKVGPADSAYTEVLAMRRALLGAEHPEYAFTAMNYAMFSFDHGAYVRSLALSREVLALRGRTLPESHPSVAASLQTLGRSLDHVGDTAGGRQALEESLALRRRYLPATSWMIANSEGILGEHFSRGRAFSRAEPLLLRADSVLHATFGDANLRTQTNLRRVVGLYDAMHQPRSAATYRARVVSRPDGG